MSLRSGVLSDEGGFTLIELMMAMSIGVVIMLGLLDVLDNSVLLSTRVSDRTEAVARGRTALEVMTRQLRSSVCPAAAGTQPTPLTQADVNSVTFYTDLSGGASTPERHQLVFDPAARTVTERDYVGTGTWPVVTYPAPDQPTRTRQLLTNAVAVPATAVFSYYAFTPSPPYTPTVSLSPPLSAPDLTRAVEVAINFAVQPARTNQAPQSTTLQDRVLFRSTNVNDPSGAARCL